MQKNWDKEPYYSEGEAKFNKDFSKALRMAVDQNYVAYGKLTFYIFIDEKGLAKIIDVKPKIKNSDLLISDMNYLLRKSNKKWKPAMKENIPVKSFYIYNVNFNTEVYDEY